MFKETFKVGVWDTSYKGPKIHSTYSKGWNNPSETKPSIFGDGYTLEKLTMEHDTGGVVQMDFPLQIGDV